MPLLWSSVSIKNSDENGHKPSFGLGAERQKVERCTFSETEILAQLEVTGGSVPSASKVKGRTVRLKLSQVNSASMDSFRCCTIDPGRRVPVHNS